MESFSIHGDNMDVSKIMEKIQQRIKNKQKSGIYTDDELEEVTRLRLETLADNVDIDSSLINHLRSSSATWNISSDYKIKSHRVGFSSLIVLLKKLVRPFIRLYTDNIIERQAQLNLYSIHILHNLVQEMTLLQIENRKLKSRLDRIEKSHRFTSQQQKSQNRSPNTTKNSGQKRSPNTTKKSGQKRSPNTARNSGQKRSPNTTRSSGQIKPPSNTRNSGKIKPPNTARNSGRKRNIDSNKK